MTKPLAVVDAPGTNLPQPTRQLGQHGLDLWRSVMAEYYISDPRGLAILRHRARSRRTTRRGDRH
jgi:hypothetical protein